MSMDLFRQLLEAQRIAQADLLRRRGVVGVAIGYRNYKEQSPTNWRCRCWSSRRSRSKP